jgi:hypothetical protein
LADTTLPTTRFYPRLHGPALEKIMNTDLARYIKLISHKIRTPLSIIQNELSCIKGKISSDEYQRIIEECRKINAILKESEAEAGPDKSDD